MPSTNKPNPTPPPMTLGDLQLGNGERNQMTIQARVVELEEQHHALEKKLVETLKHKSADDLEIIELKRQKLHLKDEIERLQHDIAGDNQSQAS